MGVPGLLKHFDVQARELDPIAVLHRHEGIFCLGAGAETDGCAATVAQFQMAGPKVGVEMSEKDVADLKSHFLGVGQVLLNIALGIDDNSGRTWLVPQQIGGVGETAQIVLLQNHGDFYSLAPRFGRISVLPNRDRECECECETKAPAPQGCKPVHVMWGRRFRLPTRRSFRFFHGF
jgi:hypothetical protein